MKINTFTFVIAFLISLLVSYSFYILNFGGQKSEEFKQISSIISFLFSATTLIMSFGISYESSRTGMVIRSFSISYFIFGIAGLIMLKIFLLTIPLFIIISGIMILIYALIVYSVFRANQ
jgi:hypothetical protein